MLDTAAHYLGLLGLELGATPDEVHAKYRAMVRMWHPDRFAADSSSSAEAATRMRRLNEAMSWLRDHEAVWVVSASDQRAPIQDATARPSAEPAPSQPPYSEGPGSESRQGEAEPSGTDDQETSPSPTARRGRDRTSRDVGAVVVTLLLATVLAFWLEDVFGNSGSPIVSDDSRTSNARTLPSVPARPPAPAASSSRTLEPALLTPDVTTRAPIGLTETVGVGVYGRDIAYREASREPWGDWWVVVQVAVDDDDGWVGHLAHSRIKVVDTMGSSLLVFEEMAPSHSLFDFTGDGRLDLVIEGHSGGSGCCSHLSVYQIGDVEPEEVLTLDTGSIDLVDLDGDALPEVITISMLFRYVDFSGAGAPFVPQVFEWTQAGLVDVTRTLGRHLLQAQLAEYRERIIGAQTNEEMSEWSRAAVVGWYGNAWLLSPELAEAEMFVIRSNVGPELSAWLDDRTARIVADLSTR